MPPKPRDIRMEKDPRILQRLDQHVATWQQFLRRESVLLDVARFIRQYREGEPTVIYLPHNSSYNTVYRIEYEDGGSAIMKIPIHGMVASPDEKVRYEVATMRYVSTHTTIPVPRIYHYGTAAENPTGLGAFIIMEHIDYVQTMSQALVAPEEGVDEVAALDSTISEAKIELLYGQMANIILQLSTLTFPRIGSLVENNTDGSISVQGRPLITYMNDVVVQARAEDVVRPSTTYESTGDWYGMLGFIHVTHLMSQDNGAVEDVEDDRDKFVARSMFRNLAREGRLSPQSSRYGEIFRLFSESLRPENVLLDVNMRVVGVTNWEFAYSAPEQCSFDPPLWLLLVDPEYWPGGYSQWMTSYQSRLQTFLRVLESEETKLAQKDLVGRFDHMTLADTGKNQVPLSQLMRQSWENRTWMLNYAARKGWAFDYIWWKFLDERFFGPNDNQDYHARLGLLTESQMDSLESLELQRAAQNDED